MSAGITRDDLDKWGDRFSVTLKDLNARKNPKGGFVSNSLNTISAGTGRAIATSMPGGAGKA